MTKGIYVALSSAVAETKALDTAAHNIANASTTGFRAQRLTFAEVLDGARQRQAPPVAVDTSAADDRPGAIRNTGNPLDVAISGEGYFALETPGGERFTRAGNFHLDGEGTLVSADGHPVLDESGARIELPAGAASVSITADGGVHADGVHLANVGLFALAGGSVAPEGALLAPGKDDPPAVVPASGELVPGALEHSNFDVVRGMVEIIRVSRSYEAATRMIEGYKQMDERTARAIGER